MDFETAMSLCRTGVNVKRPVYEDVWMTITTLHPDGHLRTIDETGVTSVWKHDRESIEATDWQLA